MGRAYVQTDAAANLGEVAACSGAALGASRASSQATSGGTAGVTAETPNARSKRASVMIELAPSLRSWPGGTWTIPVNITTANSDVDITEVYVCRLTSGGSAVATVGSTTGLTESLATTGVKTLTVSGAATSGDVTDVAYIVVVFETPGTTEAFGWTPDQTVMTPLRFLNDHARSGGRVNKVGRLNSV